MERPSQGTRKLGHAILRAAQGTGALGCPRPVLHLARASRKPLGKGVQVLAGARQAGQRRSGKSQEDVGGTLL